MKKALLALGVATVAMAAAVAGSWAWSGARIARFAGEPYGSDETKVVELPAGSGPKAVAAMLYQGAVVSSSEDLFAYLRRERLGPRLKAGEYEFKGPLTPRQVVERI
ncbi:MAG: hypothetical protein ACYC8T_34230, partial [Myxococcaceae bacterium]